MYERSDSNLHHICDLLVQVWLWHKLQLGLHQDQCTHLLRTKNRLGWKTQTENPGLFLLEDLQPCGWRPTFRHLREYSAASGCFGSRGSISSRSDQRRNSLQSVDGWVSSSLNCCHLITADHDLSWGRKEFQQILLKNTKKKKKKNWPSPKQPRSNTVRRYHLLRCQGTKSTWKWSGDRPDDLCSRQLKNSIQISFFCSFVPVSRCSGNAQRSVLGASGLNTLARARIFAANTNRFFYLLS